MRPRVPSEDLPMLVKKYSNRRLYDTDESRYITLEELADKVRGGADVQIVDAKTGEDLTQATLTQIILEGPAAKLLPVPLLSRLIRMQDDALGEFFGKYMSGALEMYLSAKQGAQSMAPYFPFATVPLAATNAFARMMGGLPFWGGGGSEAPPVAPPRAPSAPEAEGSREDVAELRNELEALKKELRARRKPRTR
jgi:polyhydroxyalkanoate synthesis repressor PhaR